MRRKQIDAEDGGWNEEGFDDEFEQGLITKLYEQEKGTKNNARICKINICRLHQHVKK